MKLRHVNLDELVHASWLDRTVQNTKAKLNDDEITPVPSEEEMELEVISKLMKVYIDRYVRLPRWIVFRLGGGAIAEPTLREIMRTVITSRGKVYRFCNCLAVHKSMNHTQMWSGGTDAGAPWTVNRDGLVYDRYGDGKGGANDISHEIVYWLKEKA